MHYFLVIVGALTIAALAHSNNGGARRQECTVTRTRMMTQTHYDTMVVPQQTFYTRYVTIKSVETVPETTIISTHFRTVHNDHYTTVTPPTVTNAITITETHHKTTLTLPVQTETITYHLPPNEHHVFVRILGNICSFIVITSLLILFLIQILRSSSNSSQLDQLKIQ